MPVLFIPSDRREFSNAIVNIGIQLDGESELCKEWPYKDGSTDRCYVASRINKAYSIVFVLTNPSSNDSLNLFRAGSIVLACEILIDGKKVQTQFLRNGKTIIQGVQCGHSKSRFVFTAPTLVANGGLIENNDVDPIGTIELRLRLARIECEMEVSDPGFIIQSDVPNEKAKKGVFVSAATKFGEPIASKPRSLKSTKLSEEPLISYTFHYKTIEFLELEGIIPESEVNGVQDSGNIISVEEKQSQEEISLSLEEMRAEYLRMKLENERLKRKRNNSDSETDVERVKREYISTQSKVLNDSGAQSDEVEFIGVKSRRQETIDLTN
ncbi:hypothetical protein HK100_011583 [Physocladia obscura]|uniref:DUF7918 domain-containing protein n=1 Tax=Physocladia obscura TaxID=109957 RepID=A0AAD5XI75_9FUNG|nr:hypothetical protein HK100_011583 [Physocladia obscura]